MALNNSTASPASLLLCLVLVLFSLASACPVCPAKPAPTPKPPAPTRPPPSDDSCSKKGFKFSFCADLLGFLIGHGGGLNPPELLCCPLLPGILDLEGAVCLCTEIKFRFLNIPIDIPVSFVKLFNYCGKSPPDGFQCTHSHHDLAPAVVKQG